MSECCLSHEALLLICPPLKGKTGIWWFDLFCLCVVLGFQVFVWKNCQCCVKLQLLRIKWRCAARSLYSRRMVRCCVCVCVYIFLHVLWTHTHTHQSLPLIPCLADARLCGFSAGLDGLRAAPGHPPPSTPPYPAPWLRPEHNGEKTGSKSAYLSLT